MKTTNFVKYGFLLLVLFTIAGIYLWNHPQDSMPRGNIVLREKHPYSTDRSTILVMDGNGNSIRAVGYFGGSPTWSPDGRYIAVGCEKEICILDFSTMPDKRTIKMQSSHPKIVYRLPAPEECEEKVSYGKGGNYTGILSMSWSPDGQRLAVVCGSELPEKMRSVCIHSLDGKMDCWDESTGKEVHRVAWSPVEEDVIAISGTDTIKNTSEILLVNSQGQNAVALARGWSPEWSPDGKQLAYVKMGNGYLGIGMVNRDGSGDHALKLLEQQLGYDCRGFTGTCRISWSPDGRYLVFTSPFTTGIGLRLYRLDLQTSDAIKLIDNMVFEYPAEPDWGP